MLWRWRLRRQSRLKRKADRSLQDGPRRALEIYLPITPQDEPGILPGSAQEQQVILDLKRRLSDCIHRNKSGVVGGTDYRRREAYIYIWCADPWRLLADIAPILNEVPDITRVELYPDDLASGDLGSSQVLRAPFGAGPPNLTTGVP